MNDPTTVTTETTCESCRVWHNQAVSNGKTIERQAAEIRSLKLVLREIIDAILGRMA